MKVLCFPGWTRRQMLHERLLQEMIWKGMERIVREEGELQNDVTETKVRVSVSFLRYILSQHRGK